MLLGLLTYPREGIHVNVSFYLTVCECVCVCVHACELKVCSRVLRRLFFVSFRNLFLTLLSDGWNSSKGAEHFLL